ncbi:hypothetical protein C2845_PM17G11130 [Panicum miliaceum]|uniref:Uncharacterized protein n=1 Tax=Panicum miliaceum TaxID=4540 RepID=A0A3L6Q3F0_PANMI|nr:hypothetical protein C2845_PM17G11130 [Panicum miliaceum]
MLHAEGFKGSVGCFSFSFGLFYISLNFIIGGQGVALSSHEGKTKALTDHYRTMLGNATSTHWPFRPTASEALVDEAWT